LTALISPILFETFCFHPGISPHPHRVAQPRHSAENQPKKRGMNSDFFVGKKEKKNQISF
jgi:hypothetical protein